MLTPLFSKKWPFWEKIRNTQSLNGYPESCVGLKTISLTNLKSLECIIYDKIKFWNWFHTSEFLIFWTFLFSSQISVGGNRGHVLPPIRVRKYKVNQKLRNVCLKLTLTNKMISRKIVISRIETLYISP